MFFLRKILVQLAYPLSIALVLLGLGIAVSILAKKRRRLAVGILALAVASLWLAATPFVANRLSYRLERMHPPRAIPDLPAADAIVVLGGGVHWVGPPVEAVAVTDAGDRVLHAARLWHAGKAPLVVASGGGIRFFLGRSGAEAEADAIARLLVELGVPAGVIRRERESRTTHENALQLGERLRGTPRVLLVTSATHMPRAMLELRAAGLDPIPAPTDFAALAPMSPLQLFAWLPDAEALALTSRAWKEHVALLVTLRQRSSEDDHE